MAELKRHSPFGMFPLILDGDRAVFETSIIIEYLQDHHPGPNRWIPGGDEGLRVRFFDRFFDLYIMNTMQVGVANALRPPGMQDAYGEDRARERLHVAYDWLEANLGQGEWAVGERFTLADCAAAPALFYANTVVPFAETHKNLLAYLDRLMARPSFARVLEEAQPYFGLFPMERKPQIARLGRVASG
jgi:glutathione S-transferase